MHATNCKRNEFNDKCYECENAENIALFSTLSLSFVLHDTFFLVFCFCFCHLSEESGFVYAHWHYNNYGCQSITIRLRTTTAEKKTMKNGVLKRFRLWTKGVAKSATNVQMHILNKSYTVYLLDEGVYFFANWSLVHLFRYTRSLPYTLYKL